MKSNKIVIFLIFEFTIHFTFNRRYSDYQDRSLCRKLTWQQDDWSEIVTETGELVTSMKTGILQPIIVT